MRTLQRRQAVAGRAHLIACAAQIQYQQVTNAGLIFVWHRPYLVRFAQRKLRDAALAEDAVQDVLEAVPSGRASFEGRSALRSWLTTILKHKIVDVLRRHGRFESLDDETGEHAALDVVCPQPRPDEVT